MPGLVGIIDALPVAVAGDRLMRMLEPLRHSREYQSGTYVSAADHAHLAWTCHASSFASRFPLHSHSGDITLLIAGEVLADASQSRGSIDAAEILRAYEQSGAGFLKALNGWFSGIVIDRRLGTSYVFTDRYGMERVFYRRAEDGFYFASEAKALLRLFPECREFEPIAIAEFLSTGCTLGEQSLYKGLKILPGASLLTFSRGQLIRSERYFDPTDWEAKPKLGDAEFTQVFVERFRHVVSNYSSGGIGVSLTGGLDSRMVMSALPAKAGRVSSYTFGSKYRETFDVKVSRQVAKATDTPYQVLELGSEYVSKLPAYLERAVRIADGYMGLGGAAELYSNERARAIAPIRLTGNYGGELLRGVRAFKCQPQLAGGLERDLAPLVSNAKMQFDSMARLPRPTFAAFYQAPQQDFGRTAIERSQITPRTPFLSNEIVALAYLAPDDGSGFKLAEAVIAAGRADLLNIPSRSWLSRQRWGRNPKRPASSQANVVQGRVLGQPRHAEVARHKETLACSPAPRRTTLGVAQVRSLPGLDSWHSEAVHQ